MEITALSPNVSLAINWQMEFLVLDPRRGKRQVVWVCILRPISEGKYETYVGIAVQNPNDLNNDDLGKKLSLARAIQQMYPNKPWKRVWDKARELFHILYHKEKSHV